MTHHDPISFHRLQQGGWLLVRLRCERCHETWIYHMGVEHEPAMYFRSVLILGKSECPGRAVEVKR